jgi:hypothetical protein
LSPWSKHPCRGGGEGEEEAEEQLWIVQPNPSRHGQKKAEVEVEGMRDGSLTGGRTT